MRLVRITILILISLSFSGCSSKCEPKIQTVFVKSEVPRLTILNKISPYELTSVTLNSDGNYSVVKQDLEKASSVSKKRIRAITFYENQNMKFNREFSNE